MAETEQSKMKKRFDQLLKAHLASPKITGKKPFIFDPQKDEIRKLFAVNTLWEKFTKEYYVEFEIEERTITLLLQNDKSNPLTIIIQPVDNVADGEMVTLFLGDISLTAENIGKILHTFLTNETARKECISNNPNYLILPKELDDDDFLMNSSVIFVPKHFLNEPAQEKEN